MKYFCMPSDFKTDTIDKYDEINNKYEYARISETYGQLAPDTLFGSGRDPAELPPVDKRALESYVEYSNKKGIEFNYVINPTCMESYELTAEGAKKIEQFLKMLHNIGITWVTICLPSIMEIAKYVTPDLKIKASTLCLINSPRKAEFYNGLGIKRIVLDEDIYRRFDILKNIRKTFTGDIEIIINSFCRNDCPYKMFHYNSFSHAHISKDTYPYFNRRCYTAHLGGDNYIKSNWIRPEDIHYYEEIGINCFKIQGRTNVYTGDPAKAVVHYIEGHYEGDLISLLELFSDTKPLTIAQTKIDNRKLDGFFDKFVQHPSSCTKLCDKCGYCSKYAQASISSDDEKTMALIKLVKDSISDEFPRKLIKT